MAMPTEPPAKPDLQPIVVTVTGAAGQIGYSLVPRIARGNMFGYTQPVILKLQDIPVAMEALKGLQMELEDAHFPLLKGVVLTDDPNVGFKDSDAAILLGAFPRKQGMERKDLMEKNIGIFRSMGEAIEKNAKKTIKVLVCGNPANTNCLVCAHYAPSIPKQNFTALTRLDHNRALAQVARRCNSSVDEVSNVIIWGNHSSTQYPDVNHGTVMGQKIYDAVGDTNWLQGEFVKIVQTRGGKIIEARKASSAFSAARACVMHMHDWFLGSSPGQHVSMGIYTDGSLYGIREGLMYSMPCKCSDGKWEVVRGLSVDDFSRKMMTATEEELAEEKALAFSLVQKSRL